MLSIIPSLATAKFNQLVTLNLLDTPCSQEDMKQLVADMSLAQFDCKVWDAKDFNNVFAYFLWRQIDCVRNSKQQAAQAYLPHKMLVGKNTDEQIQLLLEEKGINWNDYSDDKKYGRFIYKEQIEKPLPNNEDGPCLRNVWFAHDAFPLYENGGKQKLMELNVIPMKTFE
jgi:tRNA(His) 5'-end guanylyltransferase